MRMRKQIRTALPTTLATVAALAAVASTASAAAPFRIDKVDKAPVIDGVPGEWQRELSKLGNAVKGSATAADLAAKGAVAYDDKNLYVAVDVSDDVLRGGGDGDRVDLVLAFGGSTQTLSLFPGQPGKSAGKATLKGATIKDAKVVEAPRKGGWTLEASVPWSAFEGAGNTRVGLKGGLFIADADGSSTVEAIVGNASGTELASLPPILTTPEQALVDGLLKDKKLGTPSFEATANVVGDAMKERVLVYDNRYVVVLGPTYRGGKEYYWNDMSVAGSAMSVQRTETRELDGDGRDDLVFVKRFTKSGQKTQRDVLSVLSFGSGDVPELVFQHEVGVSNAKGSISNELVFSSDGGKPVITIKPGSAKGLDEKSYDEPTEASFDPVLLPWGVVESQAYKFKGKGFTKTSEKSRAKPASTEAPKPISDPAPPPAPAVAKPDTAKVYALYKKDRGVSGTPKFDLAGDIAEDGQVERVVVHEKEIAVFGPGFKGGTSYVFTALPFAAGADVKSVTLRDATGDKKLDLIVRGILKQKGPNKEDVEREIELVFKVGTDGIKRVFGAEIGRSIGANKIVGAINYESDKGGFFVKLAPNKAVGFTKESYPFNQDAGPVGGVEPLLLPWGDAKPIKYKWSGKGFDKQ